MLLLLGEPENIHAEQRILEVLLVIDLWDEVLLLGLLLQVAVDIRILKCVELTLLLGRPKAELVENMVVPLILLLGDDPRLFEEVIDDPRGVDLLALVEGNLNEFPEA